MRLNYKNRLVLLLAASAINSGPAWAANEAVTDGCPPLPSMVRFGPGAGPLDLAPLNLTPEQKQKVQDMRKESSAKARDLRKTLKEKRQQMRDLMFDPNATESQLKEKHREMAKLHEQAEEIIFQDFLFIRAMLTPEQKKHLPEIRPKSKEPLPEAEPAKTGISVESKGSDKLH